MSVQVPTLSAEELDTFATGGAKNKVFARHLNEAMAVLNKTAPVLAASRNAADGAIEHLSANSTEYQELKAKEISKIQQLTESIEKVRNTVAEQVAAMVAAHIGDAVNVDDISEAAAEFDMARDTLLKLQKNVGDEIPSLKIATFPQAKAFIDGVKGKSAGKTSDGDIWRPRLASASIDGKELTDGHSLSDVKKELGLASVGQLQEQLLKVSGTRTLTEGETYTFSITHNDKVVSITVVAATKPGKTA